VPLLGWARTVLSDVLGEPQPAVPAGV